MTFLKKYWYLFVIMIITAGLGVVAYLTSTKLTQTTPVAPNVPQSTPKAAEPACTLSFTIATPSPTPTGTPTNTPTNTPSGTPSHTPTSTPTATPSHTPTSTPSNTPTATPTPQVSCNSVCTVNTDCVSGLVCSDGRCRNASCVAQSSCQCPVATNTPTPTPTPVVQVGCNSACTVNTDCSSGLVCIDSACRNPSCSEKTTCQCEVAAPTPQTPVAGTGPTVLGASIVAGGFLLVLLGLASAIAQHKFIVRDWKRKRPTDEPLTGSINVRPLNLRV